MAEIALKKISKRYPDGSLAVTNVDLRVNDGEFMVLVGPSGCGKSTLLNMVAGLETISSGELAIGGIRMNERAPKDRDIAMVFQSYALYPHMTVYDNIAFPLRLARTDTTQLRRKVSHAADLLNLGELLHRKPAQLSGGQRQRVAMGRAIVRNPKAFLMDEPLSNLDAELRGHMRTSLGKLQKRLATTTIYVTHDQTEAMTLGDRIVVMRAGAIQQVGTSQRLYDRPANQFVAGFIGSPPMNLLPAVITSGYLNCPLGPVPLAGPPQRHWEASGSPPELTIGLRPEHVHLAARIPHPRRATGTTYTGRVEMVEVLGSDTYVYLATEREHELVARLPAGTNARSNTNLTVWFDPEDLHLFEPINGTNLALSGGATSR